MDQGPKSHTLRAPELRRTAVAGLEVDEKKQSEIETLWARREGARGLNLDTPNISQAGTANNTTVPLSANMPSQYDELGGQMDEPLMETPNESQQPSPQRSERSQPESHISTESQRIIKR
ncbi:hypothetical protein EG329_008336 [Mollisiaceae sp. DMI_Dod_QoI]|nr:hypothetical protein EG329_008336 [Helotiales sp. DMI_Dod_QoI]